MPYQDECDVEIAKPKVKVLVAICPRNQPFIAATDSVDNCISYALTKGFEVVLQKVYGGVPGFHNFAPFIAHMLKDPDFTHLFCAADDVVFPPESIVRLVNHGKDMICGAYRKNSMPNIEFANRHTGTLTEMISDFRNGRVTETDVCAAHSLTIRRGVLEKMVKDYPELEYMSPSGESYYGLAMPFIEDKMAYQDDWALSIRARRSGFHLFNDWGLHLKHFCSDFLGFDVWLPLNTNVQSKAEGLTVA